jgi:hypothetical protein
VGFKKIESHKHFFTDKFVQAYKNNLDSPEKMEIDTTIRQTAKVVKPNSPWTSYEIHERPCADSLVYEYLEKAVGPVGIWSSCGNMIVWHLDGSISVKTLDDESLFFDAIPTIASAIQTQKKGGFYQFHPDGSVTCRIDGQDYFYSAPYEAVPVVGNSRLKNFWDSEKKTWLFQGFDLTTSECYKKQEEEEKKWLGEMKFTTYTDNDSDDDSPQCCRGCWKKPMTPQKREEIDLSVKVEMLKVAIKMNKNCITAGYEKAKQKLALNMELLQKAEEQLAALEAKNAAKAAAE